jgi:hypothetical protein
MVRGKGGKAAALTHPAPRSLHHLALALVRDVHFFTFSRSRPDGEFSSTAS